MKSQKGQAGLQKRKKDFDSSERGLISSMEMHSTRARWAYWVIFALLLLSTFSCVFPVYWMYSGGLKTPIGMLKFPPDLIPNPPLWSNYLKSWTDLNFVQFFGNTVELAASAWVLQLFISTTAAYSLSKLKPVFGKVILFLFLSTLMVPSMAYLIPQYLTVVKVPLLNLGWLPAWVINWLPGGFKFGILPDGSVTLLDSWWGVLLPQAASAFNIFVMKSFFDEIPTDLTDAARIDGASAWQILWNIILPLSKPVVAVITIFTFIGSWKDFFWPYLVLMGREDLTPIMVALFRMTNVHSFPQPLSVVMAGLAIASTPPIILFLIFQKQIIRGITLTGLKG